jgi:hypothetical protein
MIDALRGCWRWSNRRGGGFDYSASCFGALALTVLLSQGLWGVWLGLPHDSGPLQHALNGWYYCLGLLAVYWIEARQINSRLAATGHSTGWTIPLVVTIIGLAASPPPGLGRLRVFFALAFIMPQLPLFFDDRDLPDRPPPG